MRQTDPLIDPKSCNPRAEILARATELLATKVAPKKIISMFNRSPAVRSTYVALTICLELGYNSPTLAELAIISRVSRASVQNAVERLKIARLITTEYTKYAVGRPMIYTLTPLDKIHSVEGCD